MRRYVFVIFGGLAVVVLTGASPIADLLARVEALETENQALTQGLESVAVELNKQPVVIDANGVEVGSHATTFDGVTSVLFDFEGLPLFTLRVLRLHFSPFPQGDVLSFASDNCTGTPLLPRNPTELLTRPFSFQDATLTTYLPAASTSVLFIGSQLNSSRKCSLVGFVREVGPASLVPQMAEFTPPFRVVTRGDLQTEE